MNETQGNLQRNEISIFPFGPGIVTFTGNGARITFHSGVTGITSETGIFKISWINDWRMSTQFQKFVKLWQRT